MMGRRIEGLIRAACSVTYSGLPYRASPTEVCSLTGCLSEPHSAPSFVSERKSGTNALRAPAYPNLLSRVKRGHYERPLRLPRRGWFVAER